MPGARCTRGLVCQKLRILGAHEHTGERKHSDIPCAMALRLTPRSPWRRIPFCHHRLRIEGSVGPGWARHRLRRFSISNGCQDHTASPYAAPVFAKRLRRVWYRSAEALAKADPHRSPGKPCAARRSPDQGVEASLVLPRRPIAHEVHLALRHLACAMLLRPPHPIPTYSDDGRRPSSGMRRCTYTSDLPKWKAEYF